MKKLFFVLLVIIALVGCEKKAKYVSYPHLGEWELRNPADINGEKWMLKIEECTEFIEGHGDIKPYEYIGKPYMLLYAESKDCIDSAYLSRINLISIDSTIVIPSCSQYELCTDIESIAKSVGGSNIVYNYKDPKGTLNHPILGNNNQLRFNGDVLSIGYSIPEENRGFIEKYRFLRIK